MSTHTSAGPKKHLPSPVENNKEEERKARARSANPDTSSPQEGTTSDDEDPPGH